jgi:hypothetical protein
MTNIDTALREEIVRLSRRESRSNVDSVKKATTRHRREIAELKPRHNVASASARRRRGWSRSEGRQSASRRDTGRSQRRS